jgi:beta-phosphoglucomutase-like phosphatase (HAD superfamily)
MEVLRWAGEQCSPKVVTAVEDALCEAELRAVAVAAPTPFGHELIVNAYARDLPVAIVSNNSAPAVEAYLAAHGLMSLVAPIVGRAYADPARMKPHPGPVSRGLTRGSALSRGHGTDEAFGVGYCFGGGRASHTTCGTCA